MSSQPPSSDAATGRKRPLWRRLLKAAGWGALLILVLLVGRVTYAFRDRTAGYSLSLDILPSPETSPSLRVGFSNRDITPKVGGGAPPVWLAGFSQNRAATAVHDPLHATAVVIESGGTRLGLVVIDAIGFFYDDVIEVRRRCERPADLDYTIVCSTHNHSTPDLMGLWGPSPFRSGIDPAYREHVIETAALALKEAAGKLAPTRLSFLEIPTPPDGLVSDTRKPQVFDSDLRVMLFRSATGSEVLGSVVGWGNHPETPWSKNTEITADFPGVLRDCLENGIVKGAEVLLPGLGGSHVFVNGAVGGLMTTHPSTVVKPPYGLDEIKQPSHAKTLALGQQLAKRVLEAVSASRDEGTNAAPLRIHAHTLRFPIANNGFLLATVLGLLNRGHDGWFHMKSETALLTLGEASIACIPGEIYPEIVNGGIDRPPGGDFDIPPVETPPLRELMPGRVKFVFGLANDEIGYILPKNHWDQRPPYLFGARGAPYGEVNSVGPETGPILHQALKTLCEKTRTTATAR